MLLTLRLRYHHEQRVERSPSASGSAVSKPSRYHLSLESHRLRDALASPFRASQLRRGKHKLTTCEGGIKNYGKLNIETGFGHSFMFRRFRRGGVRYLGSYVSRKARFSGFVLVFYVGGRTRPGEASRELTYPFLLDTPLQPPKCVFSPIFLTTNMHVLPKCLWSFGRDPRTHRANHVSFQLSLIRSFGELRAHPLGPTCVGLRPRNAGQTMRCSLTKRQVSANADMSNRRPHCRSDVSLREA